MHLFTESPLTIGEWCVRVEHFIYSKLLGQVYSAQVRPFETRKPFQLDRGERAKCFFPRILLKLNLCVRM